MMMPTTSLGFGAATGGAEKSRAAKSENGKDETQDARQTHFASAYQSKRDDLAPKRAERRL